jgi:hypothetical protein
MKREKSRTRGEVCPTASLSTTIPVLTGLKSDPIRRGGPAINRPIHGTDGRRTKCIKVLIITVLNSCETSDCTSYFLYSVFYTSHCCFFLASSQSYERRLWNNSAPTRRIFTKFYEFVVGFYVKVHVFFSSQLCYVLTMLSAYYER